MVVSNTGALLLFVATCIVSWLSRPRTKEETTKAFRDYRRDFALGYGCLSAAYIFTTPWGFVLFWQMGFSQEEVGAMYVLAFLFVVPCSFVVGALADLHGRQRGCLVVAVAYCLTAALSHFRYFLVMTMGIFLNHVASTCFHTFFESWLVHEHVVRLGLPGGLLSYMFALKWAVQYGVSMIGSYLTIYVLWGVHDRPLYEGSKIHVGGIHPAFAMAVLASAAGYWLIATRWHESHSSSDKLVGGGRGGIGAYLREALKVVRDDQRVAMLGVVVAVSAAARESVNMHWFAALHLRGGLEPKNSEVQRSLLQHAALMNAGMCGVSLSTAMVSRLPGSFRNTVALLGGCLAVGALALALASTTAGQDERLWVCVLGICLYTVSFGCFAPLVGQLKGEIVPDSVRTTLYVLFDLTGAIIAFTQVAVPPGKAFFRCSLMLLSALAFLVSLGFKTAPAALGGEANVDAFYQHVAKEV